MFTVYLKTMEVKSLWILPVYNLFLKSTEPYLDLANLWPTFMFFRNLEVINRAIILNKDIFRYQVHCWVIKPSQRFFGKWRVGLSLVPNIKSLFVLKENEKLLVKLNNLFSGWASDEHAC